MLALSYDRMMVGSGVPTMFIAMLNHDDFSKYDVSSLRTGIMAGSPCPAEIMKSVATHALSTRTQVFTFIDL